jgi:mycothiol S-conjugate amidase
LWLIRAERPQAIITYANGRADYAHPDHVRVHDISGPAFNAAGDPNHYPELGEPWQPLKLALVENHVPEGEMETDLFAGIR